MTSPLVVNGRFLTRPVTGVERFARETLKGLAIETSVLIPPPLGQRGPAGHIWEQTVLAARSRSRPLISLCNFGPIAHRRQLVVFHDAAVFDHPEWFSPRYRANVQRIWPLLARRAKALATVSEWSAERLSETLGVPRSKFSVITPGSDAICRAGTALAPRPAEPPPTIVTLGSLEPRKNLGNLLQAWQLAASHLPTEARLVIVGSTNSAVFRAGLPPPTRGVTFAGRLSDDALRDLIRSSRGLVYVPLYEGYGLPPVEAAALGVPVLVSNIRPLTDTFEGHAQLADPTDPVSISRGIVEFLTDPIPPPRRLPTWQETSRSLQTIIVNDLL